MITCLLKTLQWLSISFRVKAKVPIMAYKALYGQAPFISPIAPSSSLAD